MNLKFRLKNDQSVEVINEANGKVVGRFFTPSGTGEDREGAIQVCGFDDCFELWGCGVFGDGNGNPKKDIQLLFNENSTNEDEKIHRDIISSIKCSKCFHYFLDENGKKDEKGKCKCDDLRVKPFKEIILEKIDWKDKWDGA